MDIPSSTPPSSGNAQMAEVGHSISLLLKDPKAPDADRHKAFVRSHLKELAQNPQQIEETFPVNGRDELLSALARIDPEMSLEWCDLMGDGVWDPTKNSPFALLDWISEIESFKPEGETTAQRIRAIVEQGMRITMPLRMQEARAQRSGETGIQVMMDLSAEPIRPNENSAKRLERWENRILAQTGLTQLAIMGEPAWADRGWLFEKLQEYDGAPLFGFTLIGQRSAQCPSLSPHTLVGRPTRVGGSSSIRWETWLDFWLEKRHGKEPSEILLSWMGSKGVDTTLIRDNLFSSQVQAAASMTPPEGKMKRWLEVLTLLEKDPARAAWDSNSGLPFSFLALEADRSLLAEALKRPPPEGLTAKGSLGETIWDSLLFPTPKDAEPFKPGVGAIRNLLNEVPFECRSTQGFLWRARREPWVKALAKKTLHSHPHVWVGDTKSAMRGALESLVTLVTAPLYEYQANALDVFERLFEMEATDPNLLSPGVKDVMRAAHEVLSSYPDVEAAGKVRITNRYPAPEPQGTQWHERIDQLLEIRNLNPPSTLPGTILLEEHLLAISRGTQMEAGVPQAQEGPASTPAPRSPRF